MMTIIVTLVVSILIAFLSTQNSTPVTLHLGSSILTDVPLFLVVLASILVGAVVTSIASGINLIKSKMTILGQRGDLKKSYKTSIDLKARVAELESENLTLREQIASAFKEE